MSNTSHTESAEAGTGSTSSANTANLPVVTPSDIETLSKGDKTVVVFIASPYGDTSDAVESLLAAGANSIEGVTFVKYFDETAIDPGLEIFSPAAGLVIFESGSFHPSATTIDAVFAGIAALVDGVNQHVAAAKPFEDQWAGLKAEFETAMKPFRDQIAELLVQANAAAKEFVDKIEELRAQETAAKAPFKAPFEEEQVKLWTDPAVVELRTQYAAAEQAGDQSKMDEVRALFDTAAKPVTDKLQELAVAANAAAQPFTDQIQALTAQVKAARKPFADQILQVKAQGMAATLPIRQGAPAILEAKGAATSAFADKVRAATDALAAASEAENPGDEARVDEAPIGEQPKE